MKVCHVIPKFAPSHWAGAEESILSLAPHLVRRGFLLEVWTSRLGGAAEFQDLTVHRHASYYPYLPGLGMSRRSDRYSGAAGIAPGLLTRAAFSPRTGCVLHLHNYNKLTTSVALLARRRKVPYIYSIHSDIRAESRRWPSALKVSYVNGLRGAAAIVVFNRDAESKVKMMAPSVPVYLLGNGVDPAVWANGDRKEARRKLGIRDSAYVMLHLARIDRVKNQEYSIYLRSVCERVFERPVTLLIVGPIGDREYAVSIGLLKGAQPARSSTVRYLGSYPSRTRELIDVMHASDVLILPSTEEAEPLVIYEAWAAGRYVMVSSGVQAAERVREGRGGLVFDLHDDPQEVARRLDRLSLHSDHQRLRTLSLAHSWENLAGKYADIYEASVRRALGGTA